MSNAAILGSFAWQVASSLAAPTPNTTAITNPIAELGWEKEPRGRGTFSIILTSVLTLGLCVWTAIHPNIKPGASVWQKVKYRLLFVVLGMVAPEAVLAVAFYEWREARKFHRRWCNLYGIEPGSEQDTLRLKGAFFVTMGGVSMAPSYRVPSGISNILSPNAYLPFKPPNIPTKRATHGLVASASVNQITHVCSELRRWNLRRYTDELSRNDEKDFYPVLATNWLMGPKEVQLIAEYANEIKTVDNLRDVLSPGYNLDLSPLEPFAEKLVESLQRFVQKRPPSPLPLLPDTPSQRYILEAAEYLKTPPIRTPVSRGPNDSAYLETIAAMATIPAMAEEILETRRESIKQSRRLTRSQSSLNINETGIDGSQPEKDASQASQSENSQHSRKRRKPPGQPKYAKKA